AMAARTRVVATTVGPYLRYGESLVASCVDARTDYLDLTGEVPFVRRCIDKYHQTAIANGVKIVHSCGFDSIPSDLGAYLLFERIQADGTGSMTQTTMVVRAMKGKFSGGTIDSIRVMAELGSDPQFRRVLADPHALSSGPGERSAGRTTKQAGDLTLLNGSALAPQVTGTLAPFFMSSYNTRIVRRSNALLDGAYGAGFSYAEGMYVGGVRGASTIAAAGVAAGLASFAGAMSVRPLRTVLDRLLPKPGDGPSRKVRDNGLFVTETYTTTSTGARYRTMIRASGDPGYKATSVMLAESALTLALRHDDLPSRAGILTPATAMGAVIVEALQAAGFTIAVERLA
ncbi:MAG: saccharopine dehydrogenase family protein, partial [Rhodococcus sp. (in: high G+C Gram-positive bacteria)]